MISKEQKNFEYHKMLYCATDLSCSPLTDKCIILDLDETLVHTIADPSHFNSIGLYKDPHMLPYRKNSYHFYIDDVGGPGNPVKRGTGQQTEVAGFKRPGLHKFLGFCFSYFRIVGIWSAGQDKYVDAITNHLFKDFRDPHIIYTWNDCKTDTPDIEKPLQKMITLEPEIGRYMSLSNTFVVDNTSSTFSSVNPSNGIHIPHYAPVFNGRIIDEPSIDDLLEWLQAPDNRLSELHNWFMRPNVMYAPDVRPLNKSNIFKQ